MASKAVRSAWWVVSSTTPFDAESNAAGASCDSGRPGRSGTVLGTGAKRAQPAAASVRKRLMYRIIGPPPRRACPLCRDPNRSAPSYAGEPGTVEERNPDSEFAGVGAGLAGRAGAGGPTRLVESAEGESAPTPAASP